MRAGQLRHKIVIETPTEGTPSAYGDAAPSWSTYATRWASIEPMTGREAERASQQFGSVDYLIRTRHINGAMGASGKMRAVWTVGEQVRIFNIVAAMDVMERQRETHLYAKELV